MSRTYIIAEAGVNHNGDFGLAKRLIYESKMAGADAVKFQTFKAKNIVSKYAVKAEYQLKNTKEAETQQKMLKDLELSYNDFINLSEYAKELGIDFLSTPFDNDSIDFLDSLDLKYFKIPSGEITNLPYLVRIKNTRKPIILSTGMSSLVEIKEALAVFDDYKREDIILLHCNTEYPTPYRDVNLRAIQTLKEVFGLCTGYSDHTEGIDISVAAVALGAEVIEKHLTLDRNMSGPDHKSSIEPHELKDMVSSIRHVETALGNAEKVPTESEIKNITVARKSIVAKGSIKKGEIFSEDNITTKRPAGGLSPMRWYQVIGKVANRDYEEDEQIDIK